jgi:hypothetical protein
MYDFIYYEEGWNIREGELQQGELAQLARRRMVQKDHGDSSKYSRKDKHKNKDYE